MRACSEGIVLSSQCRERLTCSYGGTVWWLLKRLFRWLQRVLIAAISASIERAAWLIVFFSFSSCRYTRKTYWSSQTGSCDIENRKWIFFELHCYPMLKPPGVSRSFLRKGLPGI